MSSFFAKRTDWNLAANRYSEALVAYRREGRKLLDLTASNPTSVGFWYRETRLLTSLADRRALSYEPQPMGLSLAREAVAGYYADRKSCVAPDDLILTTSTSEGYSFIFRLLCDPGNVVLVPTPSYPLFDFLADLQDVKLVPYELVYDHGWQIDFHSLHWAIEVAGQAGDRCRAVLVVHPNNPTGSYVKAHEIAELNGVCTTHDMALIADEVFLDYALTSLTPRTFLSSGESLTFTLSGLSKISALPQMKVAWIAVSGPEALKTGALRRLEVIADTYLSMNAPIQYGIPTMLDERKSIQPQLLSRVRENLAVLDMVLGKQPLCRRLEVEGGWYVVLRVPVTATDEDFAISLLQQTGVLVHPGHFYSFGSDGYIVISLITPPADFSQAINRLVQFVPGS